MIISVFFLFKQKTAYEMRISDWSSDVCSSDLLFRFFSTFAGLEDVAGETGSHADLAIGQIGDVFGGVEVGHVRPDLEKLGFGLFVVFRVLAEFGRASGRVRVCQ